MLRRYSISSASVGERTPPPPPLCGVLCVAVCVRGADDGGTESALGVGVTREYAGPGVCVADIPACAPPGVLCAAVESADRDAGVCGSAPYVPIGCGVPPTPGAKETCPSKTPFALFITSHAAVGRRAGVLRFFTLSFMRSTRCWLFFGFFWVSVLRAFRRRRRS